MEVEVRAGDMDSALRALKKAIARDGILQSLKERAAFGHKRSVLKKEKLRKAERRRVKLAEKRYFNIHR